MIKVLFICHGNICRSPMAEFMFKDMLSKKGLADSFYVASAAISDEEIWNGVGNPVYPPARDELRKHGITCEGKQAVKIEKSYYEKYDYLLAMEDVHIKRICQITGGDPEGKVHKLLNYAIEPALKNKNIADPWYSGDFVTTYKEIEAGLEGFLEYLSEAETSLKNKAGNPDFVKGNR